MNNRQIPLIRVYGGHYQMGCQIGDQFVLNFTKVLDIADLFGEEESVAGEPVDRAHWEKRTNPASLGVVDKIISLASQAGPGLRVTYNKHHTALGTSGRNFAWLHPRKSASHCHMQLLLDGEERVEWVNRLDEVGVSAGARGTNMKMVISQKELTDNQALIRDLIAKCEEVSRR